MTNVVTLNVPSQVQTEAERHSALMFAFAQNRRFGDDVFWLKENAELLNIFETTGVRPTRDALAAYAGYYAGVEDRLGFFPQYYRFLLSMTLDLEDLGQPGSKGEALAAWIAAEDLIEAEMSDLQRLEARRLLARRGVRPAQRDDGLVDRVRRFLARPQTFAVPNKKAAYELTHAVFYLSEYGRKDPDLCDKAHLSLEYAGIIAFLDQNADLLAEVCVAMRYAGLTPPRIWEAWLERAAALFRIDDRDVLGAHDDYHEFLVTNWALAHAGLRPFHKRMSHGFMRFDRGLGQGGALRDLSDCIFQLNEERAPDWQTMRPHVEQHLSETGLEVLTMAEASSPHFEEFFAGFSRSGRVRVG